MYIIYTIYHICIHGIYTYFEIKYIYIYIEIMYLLIIYIAI